MTTTAAQQNSDNSNDNETITKASTKTTAKQ